MKDFSNRSKAKGGGEAASPLHNARGKHVDSLFHRLLELAPDALILTNREGIIVLVNALAEQMFGYGPGELLGQPMEIVIPPRFHSKHGQYVADYHAAPRTRPMGLGIGSYGIRKDGSEFPVEISLGPLETDEGLLVLSAHRDVTERKRMEQSLREKEAQLLAAQKIQERLLPEAAPALLGFDIFGACYPAEFAAGDYFDYIAMPNQHLGVIVADVAGHGIGSALVMASTHAHMRSLAEISTQPGEILARVNRFLVNETESDIFVTLLFARLDPGSRTMVYASAGHPTGFVMNGQGELKARLPSTALPLGIMPDILFPVSDPVVLEPGDITLLFTDGLLEAGSPHEDPFGEGRLLEIVRKNRGESAKSIVGILYQAILDFSGRKKLGDDVTVVVIKVEQDR